MFGKVGKKFKVITSVIVVTFITTVLFTPMAGIALTRFTDIPENYWAYDAIAEMSNRGIIDGFPDGTFRPNEPVTREQFAKIMVRALKLDISAPSTATFLDVSKNYWAFPYVESAKDYLTGWRLSDGRWRYKPTDIAVREDMAVALVRAKGYENYSADLKKLDSKFADSSLISASCRKYVAIAVEKGIMDGYGTTFSPQGILTRAQAAILIYNASLLSGSGSSGRSGAREKIVVDDENNYNYDDDDDYDDDDYEEPYIRSVVSDSSGIHIEWDRIRNRNLLGYRVVISEDDKTPKYPDDGYLYYITDDEDCEATIDNRVKYKDGDFGDYLKYNEYYYISITAVYKDAKIAGNVKRVQYKNRDKTHYGTPELEAFSDSEGVHLSWNELDEDDEDDFVCYKVLISRFNPNPSYPEDGYLYTIYDEDDVEVLVDNTKRYTKGDFDNYLKRGTKYYFAVAAVYDDDVIKVSDAVRLEYKGPNH